MSEVAKKLSMEIESALDSISGYSEIGGDNYAQAVKSIKILHDAKVEEEKIELEKQKLEIEKTRKETEEKREQRDKWIGVGLKVLEIGGTAAGIIVPVCVYKKAFAQGLEFEKDATYSSPWLRNAMSNIKPKR